MDQVTERETLTGSLMTVRRLRPGEWPVLQRLRLTALSDVPTAFLADHEEFRWPTEQWIARCASGEWYAVSVGGRDAGLVRLAQCPEPGEVPHVEAMWVAPAYRRRGAATLLLRHVEEQARRRGERVLGLWVFDTNPAARTWYERFGYRPIRPAPRRQRLNDLPGHRGDRRIEEELRKQLVR
jgi:GNAT superfamily N-acetyltransferase